MFASHTQATVAIPFDPPHTVTVRRLTGRELEAAAAAHRGELTSGSARAWPAILRRALEKGPSDPLVLQALAHPLMGYDRFSLVRSGLVAWSYALPIKPPLTPGEHVDAVEDLDDEGVEFIATEVLRLTKPALFLTPEAAAEEKKTDSAGSIAP